MRTSLFMDELNLTVKTAISDYAAKKGLTFSEAEAKTKLRINGVFIPRPHITDISVEIGERKKPRRVKPNRKIGERICAKGKGRAKG